MRALVFFGVLAVVVHASFLPRMRQFGSDVRSDVMRVFDGPPQSPNTLLLRSSRTKDCSAAEGDLFSLAVPMGKCLNNHDFSKVSCDILHSCLLRVPKGGVLPYEQLVQCTGAPSMRLSVINEVDETTGRLRALVYPLSRSCSDVPVPLHYAKGACASVFAVSKKCGVAGAAVDW